ncbi:MAG: ribosome small subunit-dependent GTPase A [Deltaproteobacteria bacterium]|nr:ribosome small subunit-dependent GTPase A [Deltaproteobacteria bacterium]
MHELSALGFGPFFAEQITNEDTIVARVAAEHRGGYEVWSAQGDGFAQLAGRLTYEQSDDALPGVGDFVTLKAPPDEGRVAVIDRVLTRRTVFTRGAAGRVAKGQVVAANVDTVFAVCGLDDDFNVRRVERYLARIWAGGAQPVVVLSKADLCDDIAGRVANIEAVAIGVPVIVTSVFDDVGIDDMAGHIPPGTTAALVGSSGAGKSTLINALLGDEIMATGEVRHRDGRGRHTTTHRQLIALPNGGLLIDTPGMRELQLFDEEGLGSVFADIEALAARCRFSDCTHRSEPGCAVRVAIDDGELSADRFEHYEKLEKEARAYEVRHDAAAQRKQGKQFNKIYKEAIKESKRKRGR